MFYRLDGILSFLKFGNVTLMNSSLSLQTFTGRRGSFSVANISAIRQSISLASPESKIDYDDINS
jgi:hypothetical protein